MSFGASPCHAGGAVPVHCHTDLQDPARTRQLTSPYLWQKMDAEGKRQEGAGRQGAETGCNWVKEKTWPSLPSHVEGPDTRVSRVL